MKKLEEMTEPDLRSTTWGVRLKILADFYEDAERVPVNEAAPEDVRSYMEAVKTLFVYGWFYYPFYTLAAFLATTAVEMALRARFPKDENDRRGLGKLFKQAVSAGLLRDEKFVSLKHVQANRAMVYGEGDDPEREPSLGSPASYAEGLASKLTHFRNVFAHPHGHWIFPPGQAYDFLILAGEVINQLWPAETRGPA